MEKEQMTTADGFEPVVEEKVVEEVKETETVEENTEEKPKRVRKRRTE